MISWSSLCSKANKVNLSSRSFGACSSCSSTPRSATDSPSESTEVRSKNVSCPKVSKAMWDDMVMRLGPISWEYRDFRLGHRFNSWSIIMSCVTWMYRICSCRPNCSRMRKHTSLVVWEKDRSDTVDSRESHWKCSSGSCRSRDFKLGRKIPSGMLVTSNKCNCCRPRVVGFSAHCMYSEVNLPKNSSSKLRSDSRRSPA